MNGHLKALGLALGAVFVLSAVVASAASGAEKFHFDGLRTIITATTEAETASEFTAAGITVKCHDAYEGTVEESTPEVLTLTPTYSKCDNNTEVRTNHCAYRLTSVTDPNGDAPVHTECAEGSKLEIDIKGVCTLSFGEQIPKGGVHYFNVPSSTFTIEWTVEGKTFTKSNQTGNQFFCGAISGTAAFHSKLTAHCFRDENASTLIGTAKTTPSGTVEGALTECKWE
jgi:hypothetical protein